MINAMQAYKKSITEVLSELKTDECGLTEQEAEERLQRYGDNTLQTSVTINPFLIFINQFKNFIIYILLFAVCFSLLIGEYVDSLIILTIVLLNAFIGFFQELSAHKSLEALKKMSAIKATVLRNDKKSILDANLLVPGDIIHLEAGDKVPADVRLIHSVRLKVEEAVLTGECLPTEKNPSLLTRDAQIGDQCNMLFSSTAVVTGNGKAVVVATGMTTEIGKITSLIKEVEEEMTPLQRRLDTFGKKLGLVIIGICAFIFLLSFARDFSTHGFTPQHVISYIFIAVSLAVAAVPTALPAVVTIALSIGVKRLLRKKALVRKLSSVETLGSCDVICTDKTGTLTENQMTVRHAWTIDRETTISGTGYTPEGDMVRQLSPLLYTIGLLANNASLQCKAGEWVITGDPTEGALLTSAAKAKLTSTAIRKDELPFDAERKLMSVLMEKDDTQTIMYTKGAPGELLACCSKILTDGQEMPLTEAISTRIMDRNDSYASQALRVLAFAYKNAGLDDFSEENLVFVGLQAMIDPPRHDVAEAIAKTKQAGIRTIIITGDYQATAQAIGKEIGIDGAVLTGTEMEGLDEEKLIEALRNQTNIFARVIPEHKQRIVSALQKMGHTVAMTGDGVNDAPALKKADIGIAVGSGTEVAKEASDFVLLDDSFTHIVNAIEEGRGIYDNIQKSIMLLLSGNLGEVLIIFLAVLFGMNLPLTAILLLWINMVTDGAPALAYCFDPYGKDIMLRAPKPMNEGILPKQKIMLIGVLGVVGTAIALILFALYGGRMNTEIDLRRAQTMVFNFVVLYECILIFVIRVDYKVRFFSNFWVWASVVLCIILQSLLMYTPMKEKFKIIALSGSEIGALALAGLVFYFTSLLYHRWTQALDQNH